MIDLNDMLIFERVAREGSFSSASRALGQPKSTLSDRVARLEEALNVRLLQRTTRRLALTEAGRLFYERCVQVVENASAAVQEVQAATAQPTGVLRISAPQQFGQLFLGPLVNEYLSRWPEMKVELSLETRLVDLIREGFDLAIRIGALEDSSLVARRLSPTMLYCVASPDYLKRFGTPKAPGELYGHRILALSSPCTWDFGEEERVRLEPQLAVNCYETLRDAALAGLGIALQPAYLCQPHVTSGTLIPLFDARRVGRGSIYAVYPFRQRLAPKVSAFLDLLQARLQPFVPLEWDSSSSFDADT